MLNLDLNKISNETLTFRDNLFKTSRFNPNFLGNIKNITNDRDKSSILELNLIDDGYQNNAFNKNTE